MNESIESTETCKIIIKDKITEQYLLSFRAVNLLFILYFLLKTKNKYTFTFLFSIFCFESFNIFSSLINIPNIIRSNITHILYYFFNIAFLYFLYNYIKIFPNIYFVLFYVIVFLIDIFLFFNIKFINYNFTQLLLFLSILIYYYPLFSKTIKNIVHLIYFVIFIIVTVILNEKYNCQNMYRIYQYLKYDVIIEVIIVIMIHIICRVFYKL
jgi:hypothetical protein